MRETLEEVRKHIPKVFINLVLLGNISEVRSNFKSDLIARLRKINGTGNCSCEQYNACSMAVSNPVYVLHNI